MRKKLTLFQYELKFALTAMKRHLLLSLSAMSAVMISFLLASILLAAGIHINQFINTAQGRMNIHVVMNDDLSQSQKKELEKQLQELNNVEKVAYSSKEEELEILIGEKGDSYTMYRGENNPLSDAYFVNVADQNAMKETAAKIETLPGVFSVAYGGSNTVKFINLLHTIRYITWGVTGLLILLSLYLIYNTIKTTIESREMEIQIMRQVGAESSFITVPFVLEGIFIGLGGALVPLLLIFIGYPFFYNEMGGRIFANVFSLMSPLEMDLVMGSILILSAIAIGGAASYLAVKRYLTEMR